MMDLTKKWRQKLHIEPPIGWLNDPNGLSFFKNNYHVYFQYGPDDACGRGPRGWGHYKSPDMLNWEFTGEVLMPDIPEDRDGVYSGCAVPGADEMALYYTGNVKEPGDYDYILSGRKANVIRVLTPDGHKMGKKQVLLTNADYPEWCGCHVRDPKVWIEEGLWHMVLGARTRDDRGCVLLYNSPDGISWSFDKELSLQDFGYMWECPDIFEINGKRLLSISPQGLKHGRFFSQNIYSSGYMELDGDEIRGGFKEWDYGFDFYAPQSFKAPDKRRILIGWMGIGDIPYTNPTVGLGRQHCLTIPREISADSDGHIIQRPVREIEKLKCGTICIKGKEETGRNSITLPCDITASDVGNREFLLYLGDFAVISFNDGILELRFTDDAVGCGRDIRRMELGTCRDLRIIADCSSLEIYADGGRGVMSTRFYPEGDSFCIIPAGLDVTVYKLNPMRFDIAGDF